MKKSINRRRYYLRYRGRYIKKSSEQRRARTALIAELKLARGCEKCGYREHSEALDFHHPTGRGKNHLPSRDWRVWGLARIRIEVTKCKVLCANCHRVETRREAIASVR